MSIMKAGCAALALSILAILAHSQSASADDMVHVNISDHEMLNSLARTLNADVSQIPLTVQVPIRVAATACGMEPRELAANDSGELSNCDAMTTTPAFRRVVRRQLMEE